VDSDRSKSNRLDEDSLIPNDNEEEG